MSVPRLHQIPQARRTTPARSGCDGWRIRHIAAIFALGLWHCGSIPASDLPLKDQPHLRRPITSVWLDHNKRLAIANQNGGTISIVDFAARNVTEEIAVGQHLSDLTIHPKTGWLLATDEKSHELIV